MINYIKKFFSNYKKNTTKKSFLCKNSKRLSYFSSAFAKKNINIIISKNDFTCYIKNQIILPQKIEYLKNKENFIYIYIYKIIFLIYTNVLELYINDTKKNQEYLILSLILSIKTVRNTIKHKLQKFKKIEKIVYSSLNDANDNLKNKNLLFKIAIDKIKYIKNNYKYKVKPEIKKYLYKIENNTNIKNLEFESIVGKAYNEISNIYTNHEKIQNINILWGHVYQTIDIKRADDVNPQKELKTLQIKNITEIIKTNNNIVKKKKNTIDPLHIVFDYKKIIDKCHKKNTTTSKDNNIQTANTLPENTIRYLQHAKYISKSNIVKNQNLIFTSVKNELFDKYEYKEWDFNINQYKNNWCKIFECTENDNIDNKKKEKMIKNFLQNYKKEILAFKQKLKFIVNDKEYLNRQKFGQDIDIDAIIDNYKEIKKSDYDKIYKYTKNKKKDMSIIILIDSSLSTESYIKNEKTIDFIKKISFFLAFCLENVIEYEISTFHSNTRHDCRYKKLKNFTDKLNKKKYNIFNIFPCGYTRIGPAIRHSISILKKKKEKKKIIILITDGNPTDYDEYEGIYGMKDIKSAIIEGKNQKIIIKSIITTDNNKTYLTNMLGLNNYITTNKISHKKFIKIFNKI